MKQFQLPLPPTINSSQKVGNGRFYKSREYTDYVHKVGHLVPLKSQRPHYPKPTKVRLDIGMHVWRDCDIDSRLKALLDAMNGYLYEDDSQVFELSIVKVKVPKTNTCVWIKPSFITEEEQQGLAV